MSIKIKSMMDSFRRLFRCIRVLGPWLGYRYWRLDQYARKDPELVSRWCDAMDRLAELLREDGKLFEAGLLQQWSDKCREAYVQYLNETH